MKKLSRLALLAAIAVGTIAAGALTSIDHRSVRGVQAVSSWPPAVDVIAESLEHHDIPRALAAWRDAHTAALRQESWEGMLEAGRAYLRIGEAVDFQRAFVPRAREDFLSALVRARDVHSIDGVLSAGEAFASLGDVDVVWQAARIAEALAGSHPSAATAHRLSQLSRWTQDPFVANAQR